MACFHLDGRVLVSLVRWKFWVLAWGHELWRTCESFGLNQGWGNCVLCIVDDLLVDIWVLLLQIFNSLLQFFHIFPFDQNLLLQVIDDSIVFLVFKLDFSLLFSNQKLFKVFWVFLIPWKDKLKNLSKWASFFFQQKIQLLSDKYFKFRFCW